MFESLFSAVFSLQKFIRNINYINIIQNIIVNVHQQQCVHNNIFACFFSVFNIISLHAITNIIAHDVIRFSSCSRLFAIVDLRYAFLCFKAEKIPSLSVFVACESKSNLTIFSTLVIKKCLCRDISCNFLIMVLISFVSLSLSSNKLVNNFNCGTRLLMPTSSLLNSNKKVLSCKWLTTSDKF